VSCCHSECVALDNNVFDCGACGMACSAPHATSSCGGGACGIEACEPGWLDCDNKAATGCEVNGEVDLAHCGACGNLCAPVAHGAPGCIQGVCGVATCNAGFGDCDM